MSIKFKYINYSTISMGRTTITYRMRMQALRDKMMRIFRNKEYKELWERTSMLASAASTFDCSDTDSVITYCMLLDIITDLNKLEEVFNKN